MSAAKELRKKEYAGRKEPGAHSVGKPIAPHEDVNHHSGRQHPPATVLSDSKLLGQNAYGGKLRKSDEKPGKK